MRSQILPFLVTYPGSPNEANGRRAAEIISLVANGIDKPPVISMHRQPPEIRKMGFVQRFLYLVVAVKLAFSMPKGFDKKTIFSLKESVPLLAGLLLGNFSPWERRRSNYYGFDILLTQKHLNCWQALIDSEYDFGLIVSDDSFIKSSGELGHKFADLLDKTDGLGELAFVDLSSTYSRRFLGDKLGLETKIINQDIGLLSGDFYSNNNVCYLITKPLAEQFMDQVWTRPWLRISTIDWLTTHLGRKTEGVTYFCFEPGLVEHGSVTGNAESSILDSSRSKKAKRIKER